MIAAFTIGYKAAPRNFVAAQPVGSGGEKSAPAGNLQTLPSTRKSDDLDPVVAPAVKQSAGESIGEASESHDRAGAQALARKTFDSFGKYVQNFEPGGFNSPHPDLYFLPSHYSGWPGICAATGMSIDARPDGGIYSRTYFLVVGSFKSPNVVIDKSKPGYEAYKRWENNISSNCAARDASSGWFTTDPARSDRGGGATRSAQLFDGVIAAARASGPLPFKLTCDRRFGFPQICDDPRKALASVDPKDIASITTRSNRYNRVNHEDTTVETHGNPYLTAEIHRSSPDEGRVVWTVSGVDIHQNMQPIVN